MKSIPLLSAWLAALFLGMSPRVYAASLPLPRSTPEAQGISSQAIREYVAASDWDKLLPAFQAGALTEDAAAQEQLKQVIANLAAHPAKKTN